MSLIISCIFRNLLVFLLLLQQVSAGCDKEEEFGSSSHVRIALPSIDKLPNEMLINVFSHLSERDLVNSLAVCGLWEELINSPLLSTDENRKRCTHLAYKFYQQAQSALKAFYKDDVSHKSLELYRKLSSLTMKYAIIGAACLDKTASEEKKSFSFYWPSKLEESRLLFSGILRRMAKTIASSPSCMNFSNEDKELAAQFLQKLTRQKGKKKIDEENFSTFYPQHAVGNI